MKLIIERANISDAEAILVLQKLAYRSEAEIYYDYEIEPLVQTIEEVKEQFENHIFLKACYEGNIIGSVRARLQQDTCYIGKLIVHPEFQNKGIGKQLMKEIESCFDAPLRYVLFTGSKSDKNLQIYENLGYKIYKEEIDGNITMVHMEKIKD